jgi:hypothetical protein
MTNPDLKKIRQKSHSCNDGIHKCGGTVWMQKTKRSNIDLIQALAESERWNSYICQCTCHN